MGAVGTKRGPRASRRPAPRGAPREPVRFSIRHIDPKADPTRDFFRYAAGGWVDAHPIPADKTRWSGFDELRERNFALLREILDEAARTRGSSSDPASRQVGTFYAAALDARARQREGLRPIATDLRRIEAIRTAGGIVPVLAALHRKGIPGAFSTAVAPDERRSSVYALYLGQDGISLPDRDYYLLDRFAPLRTHYLRHLRALRVLAGDRPAEAREAARVVLAIETALAKASRSRVDLRDPDKNYHRFSLRELDRRFPRLRWREYLRLRGVREIPYVIVGQPEFFDSLDGLLASIPPAHWRAYLSWQLLHDSAPLLAARFEREDFEFFHRRLLGQEKPEPPWKRATALVDAALGEALGRLYVERHFPPEVRTRMLELVHDIHEVFRARLERIPWMTPKTRERAVAKFDRFTTRIGHPEKYRDYGRIRLSARDPLGNLHRAWAFEIDRNVARIGAAVDREEWHMTPPTVNAHFVPTQNQIFFPAGILQPPFFDPTMDDPVNFGGIAAVIGHEITHGYDDQGRKFDPDGNLRDWWTPKDAREFRARANRIVREYSRFRPLPGLALNGALTAGENIADLGGVSLAYEALAHRLADGRTPNRTIDGFTPEQRFFLSYGQIWRGSMREAETRRRVSIDPHSPGNFRVNGTLANLPEFWKAFDVPVGAPMRQPPSRQVVIW
ncbi:MAG TPA: M13 family metallopeptidase [Thermoplasmata archaeon]|nr:M13 family metallopeptidase [Thermoplasmata archaeon]